MHFAPRSANFVLSDPVRSEAEKTRILIGARSVSNATVTSDWLLLSRAHLDHKGSGVEGGSRSDSLCKVGASVSRKSAAAPMNGHAQISQACAPEDTARTPERACRVRVPFQARKEIVSDLGLGA
jgi:hypothetical protein